MAKFPQLKFALLAFGLFSTTLLMGQKSATTTISPTDDEVVLKNYKDPHGKWKKGEEPLPGKPRDMWSVGIHGGGLWYSGDVAPQFGFGVGAHVRKSLGYVLSLRLNYTYGTTKGLNFKESSGEAISQNAVLRPYYLNNELENGSINYNYKSTYNDASIDMLFNLNNLLFHKKANKVSFYLGLGFGGTMYQTKMDLLDDNGQVHRFHTAVASTGIDPNGASFSDRRKVLDALKQEMDGNYETLAERNSDWNIKAGDFTLNAAMKAILGVEFKITKRISIGLEHYFVLSPYDDLYDGKRWEETATSLTPQMDIPNYTHLTLNYHIGNPKKAIEPLWFVNPLVTPMGDIASGKKKLDDMEKSLADDDGDGVMNRLDKEPNTPKDSPVDTHGVQLDSDGDGIPNFQDKEPFSPPGYPIDPTGVAKVPKYTTPEDVKRLGDERYVPRDELANLMEKNLKKKGDWYMPIIHFDLNKYAIKPQFHGELQQVSEVMNMYPDYKIVVKGHTDVRNTDCYNDKLSYNRAKATIEFLMKKYGFTRDRFILQWGSEKQNLIKDATNEPSHYMNRRVEFHVAKPEDKEMGEPTCVGAGPDGKKETAPKKGKVEFANFGDKQK